MNSLKFAPLALLFFPLAAHAAEIAGKLAGRDVVIWSPPKSTSPEPLILFSHGLIGPNTQSRFLTEALAKNGYWVVAPDHSRDAIESPPEQWSDATAKNRKEDMQAVLEALKKDPAYNKKMDFTHIGLAGHSLGGYTVLGLAGAWDSWRLPGVKAVLALAPVTAPYMANHTLENISAPVMYQGATADTLSAAIGERGNAYDQTPAPKYFIDLQDEAHKAWRDDTKGPHDTIAAYAIAFFDVYLKGKPASPILDQKLPGVSHLRHEEKSN